MYSSHCNCIYYGVVYHLLVKSVARLTSTIQMTHVLPQETTCYLTSHQMLLVIIFLYGKSSHQFITGVVILLCKLPKLS